MNSICSRAFIKKETVLRISILAYSVFLLAFTSISATAASDTCTVFSNPIYQVINPNLQTNLLTPWENEANSAATQYGFTQSNGTPFYASVTNANGLIAAHRLYNPASNDFIWMINPNEIASAVRNYGYVDYGVNFYVSSSQSNCTQPVYRFQKGNVHRFAVSQFERDTLAAHGWQAEGIKFYGGMPPSDASGHFYMGAASHLGDPGRKSDGKTIGEIALTEMGATSLRDEAGWDEVDFPGTAATDKFKVIAKSGGKLVLVLDYGNPRYLRGGGFPDTTTERKAFLEYANKMIAQIGYQNLAGIEVWNEWDIYMGWFEFWGWTRPAWDAPCPDDRTDKPGCPVMYGKLVETLLYPEREGLSVPSLRQTAPGIPVIVNAISARNAAWTTASMNYLRDHDVQVDGAVIHPYVTHINGCPGTSATAAADPQVAVDCIVTVSDEIARDYGRQLPMWVTEVGWSRGGSRAVSADVQARYLVETYVRARATNMVRGLWWYDIQDDNVNDASEANFGLVGRDPTDRARPGAFHPSGQAFSALAHFWADCTSVNGAYKNNRTFQLSCANGPRQIILAATVSELAQASAGRATLVDLLGQQPDVPAGGNISPLIGHPVGVR